MIQLTLEIENMTDCGSSMCFFIGFYENKKDIKNNYEKIMKKCLLCIDHASGTCYRKIGDVNILILNTEEMEIIKDSNDNVIMDQYLCQGEMDIFHLCTETINIYESDDEDIYVGNLSMHEFEEYLNAKKTQLVEY